MKSTVLGILIFLNVVLSGAADTLVFVQAVWRHGDRSPTETYKNDEYQEDSWHQGWGQLSPRGMVQHLNLGERLRAQYINNTNNAYNIIPDAYHSKKIYVRCTDVNRTLISAMSNMVTMFPGGYEFDTNFTDYPDDDRWPRNNDGQGWVPIPIHTIRDDIDFTLNADLECTRKTELWNLIMNGPEYKEMQDDNAEFFAYLTNVTGAPVTPDNIWVIADALFIEKQNNLTMPDWVDEIFGNTGKTVYELVNETNDIVDLWDNGLGLNKSGDIDFSIEIPKIKGGALLWSMIGHMQQKLACISNSSGDGCYFFNDLVYYAYSAHDTTLAALFSALGFHLTNWNVEGYPQYSSCVTVELWQTDDNKPYVKFVYFPLNEPMYDVTGSITGCTDPCPLDDLIKRSQVYRPDPDAKTHCATSLNPKQAPSGSGIPLVSSFVVLILVFLFKN